jgi:hypothetical protein
MASIRKLKKIIRKICRGGPYPRRGSRGDHLFRRWCARAVRALDRPEKIDALAVEYGEDVYDEIGAVIFRAIP